MDSIATTGDFQAKSTCGKTVVPLYNCAINVTFTPTAAGTRTGTLTINDSSSNSPQIVHLTGEGTELSESVTKLAYTGTVIGNTSAAQTVTLENLGTTSITISAVQATGPFNQTSNCVGGLGAGASCTISVTFSPVIARTSYGSIFITTSS